MEHPPVTRPPRLEWGHIALVLFVAALVISFVWQLVTDLEFRRVASMLTTMGCYAFVGWRTWKALETRGGKRITAAAIVLVVLVAAMTAIEPFGQVTLFCRKFGSFSAFGSDDFHAF